MIPGTAAIDGSTGPKRLPLLVKMAAVSGTEATIQAFLSSGGDPNATDAEERTLLRLAAGRGQVSVCRLLLEAGADPGITDRKGVNAARAAEQSGSEETIALFAAPANQAEQMMPTDAAGQVEVIAPQALPADQESEGLPAEAEDPFGIEEFLANGEWEGELEPDLPKLDLPECRLGPEAVQGRIESHRILDRDQDWLDVPAWLPIPNHGRSTSHWPSIEVADFVGSLIMTGSGLGWVPAHWLEEAEEVFTAEQTSAGIRLRLEMLLGELGIQIGEEDERASLLEMPDFADLDDLPEDIIDFLGDHLALADPLAVYFRNVREHPLLSQDEERHLGRQWREGQDHQALARLVEGNLRFVVREARRYQGLGMDLTDLVEEGNLGLIQAALRFDPGRETRFLTYAAWWIRQSILHALSERVGQFRIPQRIAWELIRLGRIIERFKDDHGRDPSNQEISEIGGYTETDLDRLLVLKHRNETAAIDGEEPDWQDLADVTPSGAPGPFEAMDLRDMQTAIHRIMACLTEREALIISRHFGLDGEEPQTLEQIGMELTPPVSRERVRQIEERAFKRIQGRLGASLRAFLEPDTAERTIAVPSEFRGMEDLDASA